MILLLEYGVYGKIKIEDCVGINILEIPSHQAGNNFIVQFTKLSVFTLLL